MTTTTINPPSRQATRAIANMMNTVLTKYDESFSPYMSTDFSNDTIEISNDSTTYTIQLDTVEDGVIAHISHDRKTKSRPLFFVDDITSMFSEIFDALEQ